MLTFVPAGELAARWDGISKDIERSAKKLKTWADLDDLRAEIEGKRAALFSIDGGGFLVARHLHEGDTAILFVWMLFSERLRDGLPALTLAVEDMARSMGCHVIRFQSPRKAWKKFSMFREVSAVYERKVRDV